MPTHKNKICFATGEFFPTVGGLSKSATRVVKMLTDIPFPRLQTLLLGQTGLCAVTSAAPAGEAQHQL